MKKSNIIRQAAKEYGDFHSNTELQTYIKNKYNVEVLSSQITNTLGAMEYRRGVLPELLKLETSKFLKICAGDKYLAYRLIRMEST